MAAVVADPVAAHLKLNQHYKLKNNEEDHMFIKRQGVFVWVKNIKNGRKLRKFGHIITMSKRQRYVLLYVNQDEVEDTLEQIQKLPFVVKAEPSYKPFIRTEFQKVKTDETKEKEYRYGF
ncbi:Uncharacterized protein YlbG, UPF0298 family [Salinibacillus kushneri]|uniref:UPF0298 protein SAMN05421676_109114 n=2 Tax=Salinibacillus kushneri TaxID=237682 RepID=A0A1I0HRK7_9BACI|nr:Uncharacterized protein YlbG, UPF0298 family [Salinibacillus kushneri]